MTLSRELRLVLLGAGSVAAIVATPVAQAQEALKTDQSASSQVGVGEIIVTAQRKSESLQNVPVSVTAVTTAGEPGCR
jgi:iron complex outermembrane receptor protein